MSFFLIKLRRQYGFTLVELMVVVAIIGLLSSVAVPNFKKYQAKAKIAEAKLQLSAMYTAEASFFSDYQMYGRCLTYMGFDPGPEYDNRYYALGIKTPVSYNDSAYAAAVNSGINTDTLNGCPKDAAQVTAGGAVASANATSLFWAGKGVGSSKAGSKLFLPASTIGDQANFTNMTYTAGAGGVIAAGVYITAGNNSQLSIDHNKVIENVVNGY